MLKTSTRSPQNLNIRSLLKWGILTIALLIMVAHLLIYVYFSLDLMRFPFDYDQGEGFELVAVMYLSEGQSPYTDNDIYPYFSDLYPLGYHIIQVPFAWLFGAELWYGRLISFIGTLITAGAIGWAIYREGRQRGIAILLGLAFLASNYIYHIGPLFRQHYFMVMLEVVAVVILANYFEVNPVRQRRKLWIGLGLLIFALYTKQLAYATVGAVFIWLFLRNPRRAVMAAIGFVIAGALVFGLLMLLTDGYWWMNAFAANMNPYIYSQFTGLAQQFVRLHWALLVMAGLMTVYELYFSRLSIYTIWWVAVTANTVTAGKWGAGDSYFATSIAAGCILSGIFISRSLNQTWTFEDNYLTRLFRPIQKAIHQRRDLLSYGAGVSGLLLVVIYGMTVIKLPTSGPVFGPLSETLGVEPRIDWRYPLYDAAGWTVGYALLGHLPSEQDYQNGWAIVERVKSTDQPVLSEDAMFNVLADKTVIGNPVHLKNLYENNLFDPSNMVRDIEEHRYGLIITRALFYPEPVVAAIHDAYHIVDAIEMNGFMYQIWEPEPTWATRRQLRNWLEAPDGDTFEIPLPLSIEDETVSDWIIITMGRWAWLPVDTPVDAPVDCTTAGVFERRGQQVNLFICDNSLVSNFKH